MQEQTIQVSPEELRAIMKEYEYNEDIMNDEDEKVTKVKKAMTKLDDASRIIFLLYLELGASRKVGAVLGVSHSTILKEVNRIKREIRYQIMIDDE